MFGSHQNVAAGIEWTIAYIFTFYILTFILDLLPSVQNSRHVPQGVKEAEKRLEEGGAVNGNGSASRYPQDYSDQSGGKKKRGFGKFRW